MQFTGESRDDVSAGAVAAEPDGLGGEEGILERAGIYLAHWRSREFCS